MKWTLSLAQESDVPALERLIPISALSLLAPHYTSAQIEAALGPVFGVDVQLIKDGTYFVAKQGNEIIACGGWSKRAALYGARPASRPAGDKELDPTHDPARIRAFFVHPAWMRQGIGRAILEASEAAIVAALFQKVELSATLGGEPLYAAFGYQVLERYEIRLAGGLGLPVVKMGKELKPDHG